MIGTISMRVKTKIKRKKRELFLTRIRNRILDWIEEKINNFLTAMTRPRFVSYKVKKVVILVSLLININFIYTDLIDIIKDNWKVSLVSMQTIKSNHILVEPDSAGVEDTPSLDEGGNTPSLDEDRTAEISAYTAREEETDSNPTITANGETVYEGGVANNCLPFGTKVKIGENIYTVNDRMNSRYGCGHFDIFMWDLGKALQFGRKQLSYKVL